MVDYIQACDISNAGEDEHFYKLTTGIYTGDIARISQVRNPIYLDQDGSPDQFAYKMIGAFVTTDNQVRSNADGTPWETPGKVETLQASAVAEGTENEAVWRMEYIQRTVSLRVVIGE
ncbi:hypothetical protein [Microbulbifer sp. 2205BS26-8]|uniref:hypothetical protein n=1 Tax=Microbulbifer sp. 2205BS26-8 TaxID=3064386 RepID=UPI00273FA8FE|nr:hypothetical protein [Microbulbifer sp. 2205BS26-8]MDP5211159.1 hypothetical protein [Microbulbifer sp. 2205BS26-8]